MVCIVSNKNEFWEKVIVDGEPIQRLVSTKGRVINSKTGREMILADNGAGYLTALVSWNKRVYIHRLVATAFISNPNNLPQVNHIDYDKSNNCVENLEWIKSRDNILDAHRKGKMTKRSNLGSINILTKDQVVDLYTSVKKLKVGISAKAREMGIPRGTASSIINKRSRWDITDHLDIMFANDTPLN